MTGYKSYLPKKNRFLCGIDSSLANFSHFLFSQRSVDMVLAEFVVLQNNQYN